MKRGFSVFWVVFFLITKIASLLPPIASASDSEETPLLEHSTVSSDLESEVNLFYQSILKNSFGGREKTEEVASAIINTCGTLTFYFLGAEFINHTVPAISPAGYIVGPAFQIPNACICYKIQTALQRKLHRRMSPCWKALSQSPCSIHSSIDKASIGTIIGLSTLLSSVPGYFTYLYIEPLIGKAVWIFVPQAVLNSIITTSQSTYGFIQSMRSTVNDTLSKCSSDSHFKRKKLREYVSTLIQQIDTIKTEEAEKDLTLIEEGKFCDLLTKNDPRELSAEQSVLGTKSSASHCYEISQNFVAFSGAALSIASSYVTVSAIELSLKALLEATGVNTETAETVGRTCAYLGWGAMAGFRGYTGEATTRQVYTQLTQCNGDSPTHPYRHYTGETASWLGSIAAIIPRTQFVLKSMGPGTLRSCMIGLNAFSTLCVEKLGWNHVPSIVSGLVFKKTNQVKLKLLLEGFQEDLEAMSDSAIDTLYAKVFPCSEEP